MTTRQAASAETAADRRLEPRPSLGRQGTLRTADGARFDIVVSDLTRDGCRLHTDAALTPGAIVNVGLAHIGLTPAQIVWHGSAGYGCRFDQALPRGAVSAAFGTSNVRLLDNAALPPSTKASPRTALALVVGAATAGWMAAGTALWLVLRATS